jgi:RNA polymerase sigma factor (TIGR02999 family)
MQIAESVTEWLHLWREGDPTALDNVMAQMYRDLRRLAAYHLNGENHAKTMQPTALVHEAYLRLDGVRNLDWKGRAHFISVVTQIMRNILVDHARARKAAKRDPERFEPREESGRDPLDVLAVDQALTDMFGAYERCARIVELRFFGDLEFSEIADVLGVSLSTVERDWRFARAWLHDRIARSA